jgi:myo-inositol-1(or 4)-monophosphatase
VASRESIRLGDGIPSPSDYCWIVDPLDGTTNYIHQLPSFSISIALQYRGEILVGCVHDPVLRETYTAIRHRGAELNGQPIRTSGRRETNQSLVVCSLPTVLVRESPELRRMINILCDSKATLRRLGSAALNLCYIASGRLDAYWTTFASVWDVAAGALILQEAGGTLVHLDGGNFDWNDLQFVAASTRDLGAEMVQLLSIK